jgi:hypothetical protein
VRVMSMSELLCLKGSESREWLESEVALRAGLVYAAVLLYSIKSIHIIYVVTEYRYSPRGDR